MNSRPIYPAVYVIVDADEKRAYSGYGKATLIYTKQHNAVAKCPKGGKVLKFNLVAGEVVHEEPKQ